MKIVITIGDCNGIGFEVLARAILRFDKSISYHDQISFVIAGNFHTILEYARFAGLPVIVEPGSVTIGSRKCGLLEAGISSPVEFGAISRSAGALAARSVEIALDETLRGNCDALVTMPISKEAVHLAGWQYPGHTEMLAERCGVDSPLMILCSQELRVALLTIHEPIANVPALITKDSIISLAGKFSKSLARDFGITDPAIALLGLNPHAGENGDIGSEEITQMIPAISELAANKMQIDGPFPADGFFAHGNWKNYDGILAAYHDQGLIPLKMIARGGGVNFTAGLPIVRTSVDHGTAFNLAGKGTADELSAFEAIIMAIEISKRRHYAI